MRNKSEYQIVSLETKYLDVLLEFCDKEIGKNYFNMSDLEDVCRLSVSHGQNCSFLAFHIKSNELVAARLTFAPGNWHKQVKKGLSPSLWKVSPEKVACFKSLFVRKEHQRVGLGPYLSKKSIEVLKKLDTQAIICHSTLGSPNNSSQKYLKKIGFIPLKEHERLWEDIDYCCTHCGHRPCQCTGVEMILYL